MSKKAVTADIPAMEGPGVGAVKIVKINRAIDA